MHQIEIQIPAAEPSEACRTSTRDAIARHLISLHLGDQEYPVAPAGNHVTKELLGAAASVVSRRIDQCHAERDSSLQRLFLDSLRMPSLTEVPAALTERRDRSAVWELFRTRNGFRRPASIRNLRRRLRRSHCTQGGQRQAEGGTLRTKLAPAEQMIVHGVISIELDNSNRLNAVCR